MHIREASSLETGFARVNGNVVSGCFDISNSADIARVMVGHDVVINAAGSVTEGSTFTQLVRTVVDSAIISLGEGRRLWQFGGAAILNVPGTHIMAVDLPKIPKVYEAHRSNLDALRRSALDWSMLCPGSMIPSEKGKTIGHLRLRRQMADDTICLHLRFAQTGLGLCLQAKSARVDYFVRRRG